MWPRQMLTRSNWKSWRSSDNDDGGGEKEAKLSREETPSNVFQVWQSHRFISLAAAEGCPVWGDSSSGCSSFAMDPTCRERFPEELLAPASGRILGRLCIAPSFPSLSLALILSWGFSQRCRLKVFKVVYSPKHTMQCARNAPGKKWGHTGPKQARDESTLRSCSELPSADL